MTEADNEGTERIFMMLVIDKDGNRIKYPTGDNHFTQEELFDALDRVPHDIKGLAVNVLNYKDVTDKVAEIYSKRIVPPGNGNVSH